MKVKSDNGSPQVPSKDVYYPPHIHYYSGTKNERSSTRPQRYSIYWRKSNYKSKISDGLA